MGAKKRAAVSPPAKVSPGGKKARVSETPESIALSKLVAAFDGDVGSMLPASVTEMAKAVADKCLMNTVENRDDLETVFAGVLGQALQTAMAGLQKEHQEAIDGVKAEEEKVQALEEAVAEANTQKEQADKALADAQDAQFRASEQKLTAETELENHCEEENGLQPKKKLMEKELQSFEDVKGIVRGPSTANKKNLAKLEKALTDVNAPPSLIAGIGEALGKQTPFDQHFVGEAAKLIYDRAEAITAELAKFNDTVAEYAKKTEALQAKLEQLSSDLNERDTELSAAKKTQKDCIAAIKEAEKSKKAGDKVLAHAETHRDVKLAAEGVGNDAETQFKFLLERSAAVVPEAPEAEMAEVEAA